jgi:hypothetical protein
MEYVLQNIYGNQKDKDPGKIEANKRWHILDIQIKKIDGLLSELLI